MRGLGSLAEGPLLRLAERGLGLGIGFREPDSEGRDLKSQPCCGAGQGRDLQSRPAAMWVGTKRDRSPAGPNPAKSQGSGLWSQPCCSPGA
jgi:hypothetical protein